MEAGAPTPSLTPSIIDYARLQISSEKEREKDTDREKEGGREEREREKESDGQSAKEECRNDPVISALQQILNLQPMYHCQDGVELKQQQQPRR